MIGSVQHPCVLILERNTVVSLLNAPASSLVLAAEVVVACNAINWVRRDSLECSPRCNCTGHIHIQNCCGKGNNTEINSWYSLLQDTKENLMKSLRWDHYRIPKFINWRPIHRGKDYELSTSMPQRGIKHI